MSVPGEGSVNIPERLLQRAVASRVESLQVDALQLACVHPRTTSLPGKAMSSLLMWLSSKHSLHGGPACLLAPFQPLHPSSPCFPHPASPPPPCRCTLVADHICTHSLALIHASLVLVCCYEACMLACSLSHLLVHKISVSSDQPLRYIGSDGL